LNDYKEKMLLNPELWVKKYADILYSFALKRVNDKEVAQDLVQETFLGGLKSQHGFDGNSTEKTWLVAILKFKIIDHYRKQSKQKTSSLNHDNGEEIDPFFFEINGHWKPEHRIIGDFEHADKGLEQKEFYQILEDCLKKLPGRLASVFQLKMLMEEKTEVICKTLNISDTNYWVILHRAKVQLRSCMSANWINE
jgi:RNA polymerase sigma-70 factor (TIGR02943 family)